ncbi:MAG: glutathione S-transferase family protein [Pseudomonadota bacterium]
MAKPMLHVFAISHYCEKARWALDYLGHDYTLNRLAPGKHLKKARSLGLKRGAMPFLELPDDVIQGSADVVSWAESNAPGGAKLSSSENRDACREIEQRLDDIAGIHVRRYFYSEAIVDHPATVLPIFRRGLPWLDQLKLRLGWKVVCRLMIKGMDLGPAQREDSRAKVEGELDWLDGLLADGRPYLLGDTMTRADLAAASLLSPIALPDEHPEYQHIVVPPLAQADTERWASRPSIRYVRTVYQNAR